MTTECNAREFHFQGLGSRAVTARFDGGAITSDAGGLLLREVEAKTGILRRFAACFTDHRDPERVEHTVPELMAVDRIVRGVKVEHDLLRWRGMQRQKHLDEEVLDVAMSSNDFFVAALFVGSDGRQFQTVQRALARQRLATIFASASILAGRIGFAHQHRQERIVAEGVVVVEVFVAQGQGEYPLGHQLGHGMFDPLRIAMVGETGGESPKDAGLGFHLPQQ